MTNSHTLTNASLHLIIYFSQPNAIWLFASSTTSTPFTSPIAGCKCICKNITFVSRTCPITRTLIRHKFVRILYFQLKNTLPFHSLDIFSSSNRADCVVLILFHLLPPRSVLYIASSSLVLLLPLLFCALSVVYELKCSLFSFNLLSRLKSIICFSSFYLRAF